MRHTWVFPLKYCSWLKSWLTRMKQQQGLLTEITKLIHPNENESALLPV